MIKLTLLIHLFIFSTCGGAAEINNVRYPESAWDGKVLNLLLNEPGYLKATLEFELPSPPLNGSQQTRDELQLLYKYQAEDRTPEQVEKILFEAKEGDFAETFLADKMIGPEMRHAAIDILQFTNKEIYYFIVRNKKRFARPRPSQLAADLTLVVPDPGHAAYPSGHATQAMIMAEILGMINPGGANRYVDYAYAIAKRREIAGVHYPSDSSAGQYLAGKLLVELMKLEEFRQLLSNSQNNYMASMQTKR